MSLITPPRHLVTRDEEDSTHVAPDYGREHEPTPRCWCHPLEDADTAGLWIHREVN